MTEQLITGKSDIHADRGGVSIDLSPNDETTCRSVADELLKEYERLSNKAWGGFPFLYQFGIDAGTGLHTEFNEDFAGGVRGLQAALISLGWECTVSTDLSRLAADEEWEAVLERTKDD